MTVTDKVQRLFQRNAQRFVSAFAVQQVAPLSRTQEISRVRARGLTIDHVTRKQGKVTRRGYVYLPA